MIPAALAALAQYPQFILYRLEPSRRRPGKTDKLPVDWRTLVASNAQDPAIWLDYATAESVAAMYGLPFGIGFVFTPNDPFWFLDIDDCLMSPDAPGGGDGTWSPLALDLCQRLAGAAVEVSQSGRGLHMFGTAVVPPHACRGPDGLELYHEGRFVALGDWRIPPTGDASHDCTEGLAAVVAEWFPPGGPTVTGDDRQHVQAGWTDGPHEGAAAAGVSDDDLIARACASTGAAASFGTTASFAELWASHADALCRAFPDSERGYDASRADSALAMRLLFWTGLDCERTRRLMERSALARPKYERDDYLARTILGAFGRQGGEYWKARPVDGAPPAGQSPAGQSPAGQSPAVPGAAAPPPSRAVARPVDGTVILGVADQVSLFTGHAYVRDAHRIACPDGTLASHDQFDSWYGGWQFVLDQTNGKLGTSAWEAFTSSRAYRFPKVHHAAFRPALPSGAVWSAGGRDYVNTYCPIHTPRAAGDPAPFLDFLRRILPVERDRAILLAYLAFCLQYPGLKAQWCVMIQGVQGNGKSFINECMAEAIGRRHCHSPKASEITGKFNSWVYGVLMILVEDIYTPSHRSEVIEILKPMITGSYLEIEAKGQDKRTVEICCNFLLNSNHKDGVRKTTDDRRLAVFYCAQQAPEDLLRDGLTEQYFRELYDWARAGGYAIVNDYLRSYAIPDALNPAKDAQRAPATSSTVEACRASLGTVEQEIQNAIELERPGFRGGWISTHYLDALLREIGAERSVPRNKRREMLRSLGYAPHPGLAATDGRVNNPVVPEGVKSRLYVVAGHASEAIREPARVGEAYSVAQGDQQASAVAPDARPAAVLAFARPDAQRKAPTARG